MAKRKKKIKKKHSIVVASCSKGIIPSTSIKTIGVHKLQDKVTCSRLYFWKWVMNIIPHKINIAFWFGSIMHKAFEILPTVIGQSQEVMLKKIVKGMTSESRIASARYTIDGNVRDEMDIQFQIGVIMLKVYLALYAKKLARIKSISTERQFRIKLDSCNVQFLGTVDAYGIGKNKKLTLWEYKTAARISSDYFKRLKFDKQINGYAMGVHSIIGKYPKECPYRVFRKPAIRVKVGESVEAFLDRLEDDLYERADWYFIEELIKFGKASVEAVKWDIEVETFDLASKYDFLKEKDLVEPCNWGRNDRACFNYGTCPYFLLCHNWKRYRLYLKFYIPRELRYPEEANELSQNIIIPMKALPRPHAIKDIKELRRKVRNGK